MEGVGDQTISRLERTVCFLSKQDDSNDVPLVQWLKQCCICAVHMRSEPRIFGTNMCTVTTILSSDNTLLYYYFLLYFRSNTQLW